MSLFSFFGGCSSSAIGLDFENTTRKVIDIAPHHRLEYEMPKGMSELAGFAEKYQRSANSLKVDLSGPLPFELDDWRTAHVLDVGLWTYFRTTKKKESDETASLSLRIEIDKYPSTENSIPDWLAHSYEAFMNGPDGLNTKIRNEFPGQTDEELGEWIAQMPRRFDTISFNNVDYIQWQTFGEAQGKHLHYFTHKLAEDHLLTFRFRYSLSAQSEAEANLLTDLIISDIEKIMGSVFLVKYD